MRDLVRSVQQFQRCAGEELIPGPHVPPDWQRRLKADLILEEFQETISAMGFNIELKPIMENGAFTMKLVLVDTGKVDLPEVADGIVDLHYVLAGAGNAWGLPIVHLFDEVHAANMAKMPGGVAKRRDDGKILKPEGWKPFDHVGLINKYIEAHERGDYVRHDEIADMGPQPATHDANLGGFETSGYAQEK